MNRILLLVSILLVVLLGACAKGPGASPITPIEGSDGQTIDLGMDREGYTPREVTVEAGKPVTLRNDGTLQGCGMFVVQEELGINADFSSQNEYTFTPQKPGTYTLSCSMGMYKSTIKVV